MIDTYLLSKNIAIEVLQFNTTHQWNFYTNYSLTQYSLDGEQMTNKHEI